MTENVHPGLALLREVVPDQQQRHLIVAELCRNGDPTPLQVRRTVTFSWAAERPLTEAEAVLIVGYIDSI